MDRMNLSEPKLTKLDLIDQVDRTRPKLTEWTKKYRNRPNVLRCYIDVAQNEHNNKKCYATIIYI